MFRTLFLVPAILLLGACQHTKKSTNGSTTPEIVNIQLDTLQVSPGKTQPREIYRGSNTRTNDIIHTKLEVEFDWKNSRMKGKASILLKPYFYPVEWCYLNARGMEIHSVDVYEIVKANDEKSSDGKTKQGDNRNYLSRAAYVYENDSIKINFGKALNSSQFYEVVVDYVAKPNELKSPGGSDAISQDKGLYFINPTGENPFKMPQIWTQGETQSNSVWFPTIDSPNERMTQEIIMHVDDKYTTLSNGTLINSTKNAGGTRVDHWKLDQPHAPYLAMMAVGEFTKITDQPWNDKEVSYYVEPEYAAYAKDIFGDTKEMIDFFSNKLGVPYAWPKYSQIVVRDYVSGAMENTSATLHGDFMIYQKKRELIDRNKATDVISHELFHQWFGDLVTTESWSNLPLNESFATYGEYLWREFKDGRETADDHSWQSRSGYMRSEKEANLIRYFYEDKEDMFDAISYNKGGQVLHMLRKAVGDDAFFASLKKYLEDNRFKPVEIHNLRLAFEEVTGRDMNWFFNQWFLNKGRPSLIVKVKQNESANTVLEVEQVQDLNKAPLYRLPLEIDLYAGGKVDRKHIEISEAKQSFTFVTSGNLQLLNFDAERQLLCDLNYEKTTEQLLFQYQNAPLYGDRLEALKGLDQQLSNPLVYALFAKAAQNDKFFELRNFAINRLEESTGEGDANLKSLMMTIYNDDQSTITRATALHALNKKFGNDAQVKALNEQALGEQSYAICGEAFATIARQDPQRAMILAKQFENESGKELLFTIASLYSKYGSDEQLAFFHQAIKMVNGFEMMSFCSSYSKMAQKFKLSSNALTAANDFENIGLGANKYVNFICKRSLQELLSVWESKEKQAKGLVEAAQKENKDQTEAKNTLAQCSEVISKIKQGLDHIK